MPTFDSWSGDRQRLIVLTKHQGTLLVLSLVGLYLRGRGQDFGGHMVPNKTIWHSVVCFDPGGTTGWAHFINPLGETGKDGHYDLPATGQCPFEGTAKFYESVLHGIIHSSYRTTFVIEKVPMGGLSFGTKKDGSGDDRTQVYQVMGFLRFAAEISEVEVVWQSPSKISGPLKWPVINWSSITSPHTRDAIAHGIVYLSIDKIILPTEMKGVPNG